MRRMRDRNETTGYTSLIAGWKKIVSKPATRTGRVSLLLHAYQGAPVTMGSWNPHYTAYNQTYSSRFTHVIKRVFAMSVVQIRHIRRTLESLFRKHVDMTDYAKKLEAEAEDAFFSRAQAAYAMVITSRIDPCLAAQCVTDSFDDNGIDAIYFDEDERILYLIQSKWHKNGRGSVELGDALKFVQGVRDLLGGSFERFSKKTNKIRSSIETALDDPDIRLHLIIVHTGVQKLSAQVERPVKDCVSELNDTSDFSSYSIITQKELHQAVKAAADGPSITLDIMLQEWGHFKQPYDAYYGQVAAAEIGQWWQEHGQLLFARNLRKFTGSTDVNEGIKETLRSEPAKFWYFNNGITILCSSLKKKPLGGGKRNSSVFVCEGVSVVNGAQTVGCIGELSRLDGTNLVDACVSVRLISLAKCGDAFGEEITRAANTQNRVERRDFAALDPEQERLRKELQIEMSMSYWYKSGEAYGDQSEGCSIEEATVGLACAQADVGLAVQAKREVGKLWEDITRPPYKLLFNGGLTALKMWRVVDVMRSVDQKLKEEQALRSGRDRMVAVHGNRVILHQVFRAIGMAAIASSHTDPESLRVTAREAAKSALELLISCVDKEFPQAYTNSLFKNVSKCRVLLECINAISGASTLPLKNRTPTRKPRSSRRADD